ncbi:acetyltransferase [Roseateles violae]|uniref:Acetyltransferase n=1 Tax=Roseateles violae TaxID=3058042 RepID=A0ABT8DRI1_9BURK|nr:acetyltransferase [Pelomonas sp. PFR6]MDN3920945.1 acetyltransferase [Pelomonas sp. PFR6]
MSTPIAIVGAGGFAREVLQIILDINDQSPQAPIWQPVGFIIEHGYSNPGTIHGLPVHTGLTWLSSHPEVQTIIAIGAPSARRQVALRLAEVCQNAFATLVHPRAWIGRHVEIGPGSVICAGSLLTTDISIGAHVQIHIGGTIGHDATLDDFATLYPSVKISGNVHLGEGCEIGAGSVFIPKTHVGRWAVVGAGSVVTKPLPENTTAVGAPARAIKTHPANWHEG